MLGRLRDRALLGALAVLLEPHGLARLAEGELAVLGVGDALGQARLKPRAAPQWRFGVGPGFIEVEYEGVGNWHEAFVESVAKVHGVDRYDVVINDKGALHLVSKVHGDRLRPRS